MPDSKPGSKTYQLALETRLGEPVNIRLRKSGDGWSCSGGTLIDGWGATPADAYVDHIEEAWCLQDWCGAGGFPESYPD